MYPEAITKPMKAELTNVGFEDLTTPDAVDRAISSKGTVLVMVNSVCGCAAGAARPGVKLAVHNEKHPDKLTTVDRKSTRLNSSHIQKSRMPSSA